MRWGTSWPGRGGRRYWVSLRGWWPVLWPVSNTLAWPLGLLLGLFWIMALGLWVIAWTVVEAWFLLVSGTWLLIRHLRGEALYVRAVPFLWWYVLDS